MKLLLADLRALANLPSTAEGRRVTFGMLVGLGLLALMSHWLADVITGRRAMQILAPQADTDLLRGLLGYGLLACPMVATWLGLATAQRQLFETPEMWLWRQAPIRPFRGPVQVLLRAVFVCVLWASALSAPFLVAVLKGSPAPWTAYALVPIAILCCTAPLLATLLTVQIVIVRFLAGRWLKLVMAAIAALASVGFTTWLLLNLFSSNERRVESIAETVRGESLPWTIRSAAQLLRDAVDGAVTTASWLPVIGWLGVAFAIFAVAAWTFPRAHERYVEADAPLWSRRRRSWPASLAANLRNKEFAQVLQQPGALIGFFVFAVLVFALAQNRVLTSGILQTPEVPLALRHLVAMLAQWVVAVLLVLYAHMGRLALWDGAQWPLYMASPARPRTILRGKLTAIAVFLLWPLVLVAAINMQLLGADVATTLRFCGLSFGGTLAALGVLAIVGTWPRLMRPDADGQIVQGGKTFLAAIVLVVAFELVMSPAFVGWIWMVQFAKGEHLADRTFAATTVDAWMPWVIAAALAYGALTLLLGVWLGGRNYRRLLAPR